MKLDVSAIRHYMRQTGIDSTKMAYKMGTSKQAYSDILHRETCNVKTLGKICKILGVTPNDILTEED